MYGNKLCSNNNLFVCKCVCVATLRFLLVHNESHRVEHYFSNVCTNILYLNMFSSGSRVTSTIGIILKLCMIYCTYSLNEIHWLPPPLITSKSTLHPCSIITPHYNTVISFIIWKRAQNRLSVVWVACTVFCWLSVVHLCTRVYTTVCSVLLYCVSVL